MTNLDIRSYRDTPKRGESDAKWCAYVVEPNGHILRPAVIGYETELEARAAAGCVQAIAAIESHRAR